MNIQAKAWKGSTLQLRCKFETDPVKRMGLVAGWLISMRAVDDLTPGEVELRDELQAWLDAANAEYEC